MTTKETEQDKLLTEDERIKEEAAKTNKYKTRIVESEINSNLLFATLIHYNIYYSIVCFLFQIFTAFYKFWIFYSDILGQIKIALIFFWGFVEIYRLHIGFSSNVEEYFPSLIIFNLLSIAFSLPPQVLLVVGLRVLPIDFSTVIIQIIFIGLELIVSIFAMRKIIKGKTALYVLRNTTTTKVKPAFAKTITSKEIAQEVEEMLRKEKRNQNIVMELEETRSNFNLN